MSHHAGKIRWRGRRSALWGLICCLGLLLVYAAYTRPGRLETHRLSGETMGTFYTIQVAGPLPEAEQALQEEANALLEQANNEISTYRGDSILSRFNQYRGTEPQPISPGMADVITIALRVGNATHGAMNVTVGPLVNLWGFGPDKHLQGTVPDQHDIDTALHQIGLEHLRLTSGLTGDFLQKDLPDLYVDLSCMGEGYGVQLLSRLLDRKGIANYLISLGNATFARGVSPSGKPWRVGIREPTDEVLAARDEVYLQGYDISTSGSYLNYFEKDGKRYSHIIDPRTGRPIEHHLVSASVIAPTPLEANAWDIGMMVLGTEKAIALAEERGLAVYLITKTDKGFTTYMSPQFKNFLVPRK
jgi:thiamine biosynthesis lipoprotein